MARKKHQLYNRYQPTAKSCGKVHYAHKHEAEQAAQEAMILRSSAKLRVYRCINCGGWHLTSVHTVENS